MSELNRQETERQEDWEQAPRTPAAEGVPGGVPPPMHRDMPPDSIPLDQARGDVDAGLSPSKREVDLLQKEIERWKRLYQGEVGGMEAREQAALAEVRALQHEQQSVSEQIDRERVAMARLQKKLDEIERLIDADPDESRKQFKTLLDAYSEMSGQYDSLVKQMTILSDELESTREAREVSQQRAEQCMQVMMKNLEQERQEADKARHDRTSLEKTYFELLRSYREMNDRLIRKY